MEAKKAARALANGLQGKLRYLAAFALDAAPALVGGGAAFAAPLEDVRGAIFVK